MPLLRQTPSTLPIWMFDKSYYVYILASPRNGLLYIGMTNTLTRRVEEHQKKEIDGFTKKFGIGKLVYYEVFEDVLNAILQHHGTMPIKYFYLKAQKYTDGVLPYEGYCYDGSKPTSKISAILMICDAAEAALRSVGDKSRSEKIVDDIVAERLAFDQFSDCDITMKEIDIVKSTIITTYNGIRHRRVKYPDVKLEI